MRLKIFLLALILYMQSTVASAANIPLMPIQDLKPGMQGVGKTVLAGDTIEEFHAEILGVSGQETSGYSILARLYGDVIERAGGVAQGMSGSPVFIDGRLVGAVAYGKGFNDPHYCFLTPIGSMLRMLDTPQRQNMDWLPKGTALLAGGFTEAGMANLRDSLKEQNLEVAPGVNGGPESTKPLEPGSSVGVSLMTGDMTLGALGTVTWTDNEGRVLAFGHPFMGRGDSNFFMNRAWVLGVIPNLQSGYKVGNIGGVIGRIEQDRSSGVAGTLTKNPQSLPLTINVSDTSRGVNNAARVRVIEDERLLPAIVEAAVISCLNRTMDRSSSGTAKLRFKVTGVNKEKEYLELDRENIYYAVENLEKAAVQELTESLKVLMNNKFERLNIYGINVEADVADEPQAAEILKASIKNRNVRPGEKIAISVVMKPFRREEITRVVEFTIPEKAEPGKLILSVRGGSSVSWVLNLLKKQKDEETPEASSKEQERKTLKDFVNEVNTADRNNDLIIDIAGGVPGTGGGDTGLGGLLKGSPYKKTIPYDFVLDGEVELALNVKP